MEATRYVSLPFLQLSVNQKLLQDKVCENKPLLLLRAIVTQPQSWSQWIPHFLPCSGRKKQGPTAPAETAAPRQERPPGHSQPMVRTASPVSVGGSGPPFGTKTSKLEEGPHPKSRRSGVTEGITPGPRGRRCPARSPSVGGRPSLPSQCPSRHQS